MTDATISALLTAGGASWTLRPGATDSAPRFYVQRGDAHAQIHHHAPDLWVVLLYPRVMSSVPCRTLGELRAALLALEVLAEPPYLARVGCPVCSMWGLL